MIRIALRRVLSNAPRYLQRSITVIASHCWNPCQIQPGMVLCVIPPTCPLLVCCDKPDPRLTQLTSRLTPRLTSGVEVDMDRGQVRGRRGHRGHPSVLSRLYGVWKSSTTTLWCGFDNKQRVLGTIVTVIGLGVLFWLCNEILLYYYFDVSRQRNCSWDWVLWLVLHMELV